VLAVAPGIAGQTLLSAGQRPHEYVTVAGGSPGDHVASAVSVEPTTALPFTTTAGVEVKAGGVSARAATGSQKTTARTARDTGTCSRRRADTPNKDATIVGGVGACAAAVFAR
jgi:hypothetical protein